MYPNKVVSRLCLLFIICLMALPVHAQEPVVLPAVEPAFIAAPTLPNAPDAPEAPARIVRYVDRSATGSNDGTSWANAYKDLQTALANSVSGTDLWIAEGRYTPHATDRTKSFELKNGVSLYGGFPTGGGDGTIAARFPARHPTILTGNINNTLLASDNSYHVVTAQNVTTKTVLDGVTIADGYANQGWPNNVAGGLFLENSIVTLRNCVIRNHFGKDGTPALRGQNGGAVTLADCVVRDNSGGGQGSAFILFETPLTVDRTWFTGNTAGSFIGPIWLQNTTAHIRNTIILNNNNLDIDFGAILIDSTSFAGIQNLTASGNDLPVIYTDNGGRATVANSILWGNGSTEILGGGQVQVDSSVVKGGFAGGTNIITADPLFLSAQDPSLGFNSPAKDSGNASTCLPQDLRGFPRPNQGGCDMGAYEMFSETTACRSSGVSIPDDNATGISDTLGFFGVGRVIDLDLRIVATHENIRDLNFTLTHKESGTTQAVLSESICTNSNMDVTLDDDGMTPASATCRPSSPAISGVAAPDKPLAAFNDIVLPGLSHWTLKVDDETPFYTGTLDLWCAIFTIQDSRVVTRLDDPVPNGCQVGDCSLREAILAANSNTRPESIVFAVDGTFALSRTGLDENAAATGDLDITQPLTIFGNGPDKTIIDGGAIDRVFHVHDAQVTFSDLTVQNGLVNSGFGGGIYQVGFNGRMHLLRTILRNNRNPNGAGGALANGFGRFVMEDSAVYGNSANEIGALGNWGGTTEIINSSFFSNTGEAGTVANLVSSGYPADLTIRSSTIVPGDNSAAIYVQAASGVSATVELQNSIVSAPSTHCQLFANGGTATVTSLGYNIAGDATCNLTATGDMPNTDARLAPAADNGGPTLTLALLPGSPAMDAGNDATCSVNDQRGLPRLDRDGNGDGGGDGNPCDIGAYEAPTLLNAAPIADEITASNVGWGAFPVILTASDADQDPLTYIVVTQPSDGTLSGTAPNLTYKPFPGFIGWDNFTFKVNDGKIDSNTAEVYIRVFDNYALFLPSVARQ